MKKKILITMLVISVPLLMLQFSCASMKEQPVAETVSAKVPEAAVEVDENALLADKHEANGISCGDCHSEDPPADAVAKDNCMTCHEDYKELAASYLDPHNAHISYANCSDCHHVHRESEMICQGCHHTFNVQAP